MSWVKYHRGELHFGELSRCGAAVGCSTGGPAGLLWGQGNNPDQHFGSLRVQHGIVFRPLGEDCAPGLFSNRILALLEIETWSFASPYLKCGEVREGGSWRGRGTRDGKSHGHLTCQTRRFQPPLNWPRCGGKNQREMRVCRFLRISSTLPPP